MIKLSYKKFSKNRLKHYFLKALCLSRSFENKVSCTTHKTPKLTLPTLGCWLSALAHCRSFQSLEDKRPTIPDLLHFNDELPIQEVLIK